MPVEAAELSTLNAVLHITIVYHVLSQQHSKIMLSIHQAMTEGRQG